MDASRSRMILLLVSVFRAPPLADGAMVRLIGENTFCSGRVEVLYDGQWGTVCDDGWDMNDADVVCRQMGCGKAIGFHHGAHFGQGSNPIWLGDVQCSGREDKITQCSHPGFSNHSCKHDEDAGVTCSGQEIRLVNGSSNCCGRVEIQHKAQWGTVCDDFWDLMDAMVVCRQLDCGEAVSAPREARFGQGSEQTWLDDVRCTGTESFMDQCFNRGFGVEDCGHDEDAGVVCSDLQPPTITVTSPNSVVSPGEVLQFRCATPRATCISVDFGLYKSGTWTETQTSESTATFTLTVDVSHQGLYTCDYLYQDSNSSSTKSNSITITVVNLQQPKISFSSRDKGYQDSPVRMIRGHSFSIICSTEAQYPGGFFHLKFSQSNITRNQSAVNRSSDFLFPEADFVHQGNYSCTYEVTVSSRTFSSTTTEPLFITVEASLTPYIGVGVTTGLLLIFIPVLVCLVRMKNKWKCQMDEKNNWNRAKHTDQRRQTEAESGEENIYENVKTVQQKEKLEDLEESDDSDYIKVDADDGQRSDVDDDYINVDEGKSDDYQDELYVTYE